MDKKFLSAEEAVSQFGIDVADLQRLVDDGKLRALADRGSWKYRRDEIEQLIQNGLLAAQHPQGDADSPQTLEFPAPADQSPGEDLAFLEIDEAALAEGATQIKPSSDFSFLDDESNPQSGFASDGEILMIESDADVPVSSSSSTPPSSEMPVAGSLSEFNLVMDDTSNSGADAPRTDESSVIIGRDDDSKIESDSDVKVIKAAEESKIVAPAAGTDHAMLGDSSVIAPDKGSGITSSDSDVRIADSGISLERVDSGITLDSGVNLNPDSGLSLQPDDSGIQLEPDSGLTLESSAVDSGLTLSEADSGLTLSGADSGIALAGKPPGGRGPRPDDTQAEFEQISSDSSEHTGLIESFDDSSSSQEVAPVAKGKQAKSPALSDSFAAVEEVEDLEIVEDLESGGLEVDDEDAVDFEDEEDVLDASDEAFSIAEQGELSEESIASVPAMKSVVKEPSWGMAAVIPIAACAFLLLVQGLLLWDGISTMWDGDMNKAIGASIISALGEMI